MTRRISSEKVHFRSYTRDLALQFRGYSRCRNHWWQFCPGFRGGKSKATQPDSFSPPEPEARWLGTRRPRALRNCDRAEGAQALPRHLQDHLQERPREAETGRTRSDRVDHKSAFILPPRGALFLPRNDICGVPALTRRV